MSHIGLELVEIRKYAEAGLRGSLGRTVLITPEHGDGLAEIELQTVGPREVYNFLLLAGCVTQLIVKNARRKASTDNPSVQIDQGLLVLPGLDGAIARHYASGF